MTRPSHRVTPIRSGRPLIANGLSHQYFAAIFRGQVNDRIQHEMITTHWNVARLSLPVAFCSMLLLVACGGAGVGGPNTSTPPVTSPSSDPIGPGSASVTIAWDSPSAEANQACPQDLSGYRIYIGTAVGAYSVTQTVPVNALSCQPTGQTGSCGAIETCSYTATGLARGTLHFAVTVYDSAGNESVFSNDVAHTIN